MQDDGTSPLFHWQHSDNSFAFNFTPVIDPSSLQSIMNPNEAHPGLTADSDITSGFAFNFQIPKGTEHENDPELCAGGTLISDMAKGLETRADSKPKTKKKKKKKKRKQSAADPREEAVLEKGDKQREEAPKQESTELTPEQQLSRELDWCIEKLELGLRTQKSSKKQREEATHALKTLRSSKAPIVKKRQVMRAVTGDYHKKMEEERDRQYKLIRSAMSSAKVMRASESRCKAVFHRHAVIHKHPACSTDTCETSPPAEQTNGPGDTFVLRPSGKDFQFNFNL